MKITVYTPTYNRKNTLERVYNSLKRQTIKKFIWLIIDDGSTDGTEEIVKKWIAEEKNFQIQYRYKENGGVHTARDLAYALCRTELIFSVDSDDWLMDDAIERILNYWELNNDGSYAGIFARDIFEDGKDICPNFPKVFSATYQEFTYKYKCFSEKTTILKKDIINKIKKTPVFKDEKLVGEGYKWIQLPNDKKFLLLQEPIGYKEFQKDGYTADSKNVIFKNPKGFRENYKQHIISAIYLKPKIKGILGYIVCSIILKDKKMIKNSPNKSLVILFLPLGFFVYLYLKKRRKDRN